MDILTIPAIASLVFTVIESVSGLIPSKLKPPLALLLGAVWALAARYTVSDSFPNDLTAIAIGMTAGAGASGIASFRSTYSGVAK